MKRKLLPWVRVHIDSTIYCQEGYIESALVGAIRKHGKDPDGFYYAGELTYEVVRKPEDMTKVQFIREIEAGKFPIPRH